MGNDAPPPKKQVSLDDALIDMKIQSKTVMRAAKKAQKESQKYKKQAKDALKKNNEDFAKLYMTSASQKRTEALNYQRTSIKMQLMCDQVKSMRNNEKMVSTFTNMTNLVNHQMAQIDTASMMQKMQMFNEKMDQAIINQKMTEELMSSNDVVDTNADKMLDVLKQEIALEEKNKLDIKGVSEVNVNTNTNYNLPQQQQQQEVHNTGQKKEEQYHDPFLDQLKGL